MLPLQFHGGIESVFLHASSFSHLPISDKITTSKTASKPFWHCQVRHCSNLPAPNQRYVHCNFVNAKKQWLLPSACVHVLIRRTYLLNPRNRSSTGAKMNGIRSENCTSELLESDAINYTELLDENPYHIHDIMEKGNINELYKLLPQEMSITFNDAGSEEDALRMMQIKMAVEACLLDKDEMECLPIHVGIIHQQLDSVMHLIKYSAPLTCAMMSQKCGDLKTPFMHLILRVGALNAQFATKLIDLIVGPFSTSEAMSTSWIKNLGDEEALQLQMKLHEQMMLKDDEGNTILHLCARYDMSESFTLFYKFFASIRETKKDNQDMSIDIAEPLMLEEPNRLGHRPLHVAMKFHSANVARLLTRKYSVSISSATTSLQHTPAHIAAMHGFKEGLEIIIKRNEMDKKGLDPLNMKDFRGLTPHQIAQDNGYSDVCRILSSKKNHQLPSHVNTVMEDVKTSTVFLSHFDCLQHLPMAYYRRGDREPPPENLERIATLLHPDFGVLNGSEFKRPHITHDNNVPLADIADVLRVHEYNYVQKLRKLCEGVSDDASPTSLDADTALSSQSYKAALRAAGSVCYAVDLLMQSKFTNAFCIVRPPGHHAGPVGKVVSPNDPESSNGFCLLNNVAIGAAYARAHYKSAGIEKLAIIDFDVHHGNGTEDIVRNLTPQEHHVRYETAYSEGIQVCHQYKPWRNEYDANKVFFTSVHGYGLKMDDPGDSENEEEESDTKENQAWFYPASGATDEAKPASAPFIYNIGLEHHRHQHKLGKLTKLSNKCKAAANALSRLHWRKVFREKIFPALIDFQPDMIFLSAGFDAHCKEQVNWGYISLLEQDYEWLTDHIRRIATTCCKGRIISVLEGGYNYHGRIVSPFARCVVAHASALSSPSKTAYNRQHLHKEAEIEQAFIDQYTQQLSKFTRKQQHTTTLPKKDDQDNASENDSHENDCNRSKRARVPVDYVALAKTIDIKRQKDTTELDTRAC